MSSLNQKRIDELETQLTDAKTENERLEAENRQLTIGLHRIANTPDDPGPEHFQRLAQEALDTTGALVAMQKRDLMLTYRAVSQLRFPVAIRKQWSGGEVQEWIQSCAEIFRQRALAHGQEATREGGTLQ